MGRFIIVLCVLVSLMFFAPLRTEAQPNPLGEPLTEAQQEKAWNAQVDEIRMIVENLRGLKWKYKTPAGIFSREQLKEMLDKEFESSREELKKEGKLLQVLGILDPSLDLSEAVTGMYGEGIAGFYDPNTKKLNLIRDKSGPQNFMSVLEDLIMRLTLGTSQDEMIIAHELTHALDDQYFDLMNVIDFETANGEQQLVRLAVTEGTAVSIQYDFLFRKQGLKSYENPALESLLQDAPGAEAVPGGDQMQAIPPMLMRQMLFPYSMGNRLVWEARKRSQGDWAVVNKMFEDLPASTEQILHPEKYLDSPRDNPWIVVMPDKAGIENLFGFGWKEVTRDSFGEFRMWLYMEDLFRSTRSGKDVAKHATEGWDGDSLVVMEKDGGDLALVWKSVWDSEEDAKQFFRVYKHILKIKYDLDKIESQGDVVTFDSPKGNSVYLERRGLDVVVVEEAPQNSIDTIKDVLWASLKVDWSRPAKGKMKPVVPFPWEEKKD